MRNLLGGLLFLIICALAAPGAGYAKDVKYAPYLRVGTVDGPAAAAGDKVKEALKTGGFDVLGAYSPEDKPGLLVIAYSNKALQDETAQAKNRGLLAAVLKVGLREMGEKTEITMVNPEYLFRAYLMKEYKTHAAALKTINDNAIAALKNVGGEFAPFGGGLDADDLEKYHYMFGMEYFTDPVELKKFGSFDEGVQTITKNLQAQTGGAAQVYALVRPEDKTAVFGVALKNAQTGEKHFLPIIGEEHVAAMPYEIILSDTRATMLHGRYRIALHWPSLTMGTFGKIMSTPGDIESSMKLFVK